MKSLKEYIGEQLAYPDKGVRFEPRKLNKTGLIGAYELLCEEYRRRLCEMWDFNFEDSWWPGERIGEELCVGDWWVLDMPEVRYCVENNVSSDAFSEYWQFVENEAYNGQDHPRINFHSWMKGLRPEMLKDDGGIRKTKIKLLRELVDVQKDIARLQEQPATLSRCFALDSLERLKECYEQELENLKRKKK